MPEAVLVLMCKRPAPGVGKQRLAATVGEAYACKVADALLACALEDLGAWDGPVVISPAEPADGAWAGQACARALVLPQGPGNLGERIGTLDNELRARGFAQRIYAGSDTPELAAADYTAARLALNHADVVLTPAADGGVVLMGTRRPWPPMQDLPWGTATLGASLARCCRQHGLGVTHLSASCDVDERADMARLVSTLQADQRPARQMLWRLACELTREAQACRT